MSYSVCFSFCMFFSVSRHIISYHVSFSFSSFVTFLAIFWVLQFEFRIFLVGEFYCHITGPTVGMSHFSRFSVFLNIFQVKLCLFPILHVFHFSHQNPGPTVCLILHVFHSFCPYSKSYSVCVSFSMFFSFLAKIQFL
jgi:hypothetical protein